MTVIQDCGTDKISKKKKKKPTPKQNFILPISPVLLHYKDLQNYKVREHNPHPRNKQQPQNLTQALCTLAFNETPTSNLPQFSNILQNQRTASIPP